MRVDSDLCGLTEVRFFLFIRFFNLERQLGHGAVLPCLQDKYIQYTCTVHDKQTYKLTTYVGCGSGIGCGLTRNRLTFGVPYQCQWSGTMVSAANTMVILVIVHESNGGPPVGKRAANQRRRVSEIVSTTEKPGTAK